MCCRRVQIKVAMSFSIYKTISEMVNKYWEVPEQVFHSTLTQKRHSNYIFRKTEQQNEGPGIQLTHSSRKSAERIQRQGSKLCNNNNNNNTIAKLYSAVAYKVSSKLRAVRATFHLFQCLTGEGSLYGVEIVGILSLQQLPTTETTKTLLQTSTLHTRRE